MSKEVKEGRLRLGAELFLTFMKIGAFTFGGGYAMIPLIQREASVKKGWISDEEILEIVAIAESTPGPISINAATFIGFRTAGPFGSLCATLGVILPSLVTIYIIAMIMRQLRDIRAVKYAFYGIRAGVLAMIIKALVSLYKKTPKGIVSYIVIAASFFISAFTNVNVVYVIIGCALFGLVTTLYDAKKYNKSMKRVKDIIKKG